MAWEHQFSAAFCPLISIHLSLSLYLSASVSLSLLFLSLHFYRLQDLCLSVHSLIWPAAPDVGTEKICNSLSVSFSPYLSANVFHLGFSMSMSMQSLGCQTQLRGHYWQFRARLSVKVSLIFLLSGRGTGRGQNSLFLLSLLNVWTLMNSWISKSCRLTSDQLRRSRFMPPLIRVCWQIGRWLPISITTGKTCINPYHLSAPCSKLM